MKLPQGILLALSASILLNGFLLVKSYLTSSNSTENGMVVQGVIDGDTIVIDQKTRVRLRHIDAPEKGMCGYDQAVKTLKKYVVGKKVVVKELIPDQYGRGMALVYANDTLVNQAMLESGWARYHSDKTSVTEDLKKQSKWQKMRNVGFMGNVKV